MITPARFLVRRDSTGSKWMVWDRVMKRPAFFKDEELVRLALSAAENLRDALNAD